MGKDLKGKELGVGICHRKDGLYTARFVSKIIRHLPYIRQGSPYIVCSLMRLKMM